MAKEKDPFADFEDWLVYGPAGEWPAPWEPEKELTPEQQTIVKNNAALLLDRDAWKKRVDAFEAAIQALRDAGERKNTRSAFHIRFDGFEFEDGEKNFAGFYFPCSVLFTTARFGEGNVNFNGAKFGEGDVHFSWAEFGEGVVYLTKIKLSTATLSASEMVACHLYVNTHFPSTADFQRLKVAESASFSGCKFQRVPDFRDAKFDRPPDVANMEVPGPKLIKDKFWHFYRAADKYDAPRLRKLKAMALQASDHERDGYFFAREMQAKRGVETESYSGLLCNTLYDWFSGFGQSFEKPFWWWLANLFSFCLGYIYIIGFAAEPLTRLYFAFYHSLRNSLPLLGGLVRYAIKPEGWQDRYGQIYKQLELAKVDITLLVFLGIVQSIIGGILLFLFLLALRNRFRLK